MNPIIICEQEPVTGIGNWSVAMLLQFFILIIPGELRLNILKAVQGLLNPDGLFIHSNWQFLNSEKLKARIKPWESVSISGLEVDAGDYLLDWRSGGEGLRYVHHFNEEELVELAHTTGFQVLDVFYSDGETGNLGLYQIWKVSL
jgi:hypothetical protein